MAGGRTSFNRWREHHAGKHCGCGKQHLSHEVRLPHRN
ncbi:hypothetical protein GGE65_007995 [Skermanella aerolata]